MTNVWLFQLTVSIFVIISISQVVSRLIKISLSKSFIVSVALIILISMLLKFLDLYKYSVNFLITISIIPLFFSKIIENIFEQKFFIIEFLILLLILFYFSHNRILMDEDELYFWAVKYKYLIMHFQEINNYNIDLIGEPFRQNGYGSATAFFQAFITSFIGYNEGGAIFANNIIILCVFYFLFGDTLKNLNHRVIYLLILYLTLNNLSFGFVSIYNDTIVSTIFAILVYFLFTEFKYNNFKNITLLFILLIFFFEIHRISILLIACLFNIFLINTFVIKKDLVKLIISILLFIVTFFLILKLRPIYEINLSFLSELNLNESFFILKSVFLSKNYNSQFGVSYNEFLNFFNVNFLNLPEYIWHNFIWYFVCLIMAYINGKKMIKVNVFFLISFFIFSVAIIINKLYINNTSPQVFGRYISFIIIPFILINLIYFSKYSKNKFLPLFIFLGILITSTPKKTFGFFFPKDTYRKYDQWNKDYFEAREDHKKLFKRINSSLNNEIYNAIVIFKDKDIRYDDHPSLYQSAIKLDLYPNNVTTVTYNQILNPNFNLYHYFKNIDVMIYYNLSMDEIRIMKEATPYISMNREFKML